MAVYNFNEDQMDRQLLHDSHTASASFNNHPNDVILGSGLKKKRNYKKKGGELPVAEVSGGSLADFSDVGSFVGKGKAKAKATGAKRPPSEWQQLVKRVLNERQKGLKDAIDHIKLNNLYKK